MAANVIFIPPLTMSDIIVDPTALPEHEVLKLRDQIASNLERAWEITGRSEDELTGVMVQISQGWAKQLSDKE